MKQEVIDALDVRPQARYIDATVGGGGHAVEIAKRGGIVLGIDTDPYAVSLATDALKKTGKEGWSIVCGNFRHIETLAKEAGFDAVDGVLFDLGVSSMQLDTPKRGFSYRFTDASLDMRMNQSIGESSAQLVNRLTRQELYDIFSVYGEERLAGPIADALIHARTVRPIETVGDVVTCVTTVCPNERNRFGILSRIFQGLRIAVNDELSALKEGLIGAKRLLRPNGRLVVISFHSLEDRIVKRFMRETDGLVVVTKHPLLPTEDEQQRNGRSRSAKVRVAMKQ